MLIYPEAPKEGSLSLLQRGTQPKTEKKIFGKTQEELNIDAIRQGKADWRHIQKAKMIAIQAPQHD